MYVSKIFKINVKEKNEAKFSLTNWLMDKNFAPFSCQDHLPDIYHDSLF
jgi:hypothetical protein